MQDLKKGDALGEGHGEEGKGGVELWQLVSCPRNPNLCPRNPNLVIPIWRVAFTLVSKVYLKFSLLLA